MINIVFWIVFGLLTGWIGAILVTTKKARALSILLVGGIAGFIGGLCVQIITDGQVAGNYNPTSIVGAALVALLAVAIVSLATHKPMPH